MPYQKPIGKEIFDLEEIGDVTTRAQREMRVFHLLMAELGTSSSRIPQILQYGSARSKRWNETG